MHLGNINLNIFIIFNIVHPYKYERHQIVALSLDEYVW